jgi:hypothetical protein
MATLILNGTARDLRLDYPALRDAEAQMARSVLPRSILEVAGRHGSFFRIDELASLCWAAWRRDDPKLTPAAVHALFEQYLGEGGDLLTIQQAVTDALLEAGLVTREGGAPRPPKAGATPAPAASQS